MGELQMNVWCLQVDRDKYFERIKMGADGIEEEVNEFKSADATEEDCKELREIIKYIIHEKTSEKAYPNGIRDQGRGSVRVSYFLTHSKAQKAGLTEAEVVALRLYTTFAYKYMNNPLRDDTRYKKGTPCPLPVSTYFAVQGIKKLRALRAESGEGLILWRGMRNVKISDAFMRDGGTELAFMSTTTELEVAVSLSFLFVFIKSRQHLSK